MQTQCHTTTINTWPVTVNVIIDEIIINQGDNFILPRFVLFIIKLYIAK